MKHSFRSAVVFFGLFIAFVPYIKAQNATFEMVIQSAHTGEVASVDFAPDGKTFITASHDRTVRLWSRDGRLMRIFTAEEPVWSARFSPDGKHIIAAGSGKQIYLWNVLGKLVNTFETNQGPITSIQFAPDGLRFAFGNHNAVVLGNIDGTFENALEGHRGMVLGVAFSPDGLLIASCSEDQSVRIWNCFGDSVGMIRKFSAKVTNVLFSPDGTSLFTSGFDPFIREWSLEGKLIRTYSGHSDNIYALDISNDGKFLLSGSYDRTMRIWDRDGKTLRKFERVHREAISDVSFSPDGIEIASASFDKSAALWKSDGTLQQVIGTTYQPGEGGHWVQSIAWTPDREHFITAHWDQRIVVWNTTGGIYARIQTPSKIVMAMDVSPNGALFAVGTGDGFVHVYSLEGRLLATFNAQSPIDCITFTPDGERILSGGFDRRVSVWNIKTKIRERTFGPIKDRVNSISVAPDGNSIVTGSNFGEVKLWHSNGTLKKTLTGHGDYGMIVSVRFSPDGKYFAALNVNDNKNLIVRDRAGNTVFEIPTEHGKNFGAVVFSPDGKFLAYTVNDKIELCRMDGAPVKTFTGHVGYVNTLAFSPDGKHLLSGGDDGTSRLWHVGLMENAVFMSDDHEWIMFTPEGLFDASTGGGRFVAMINSMHAYGVDQFATANNRPDLILERLAIGSDELRQHYAACYRRRLPSDAGTNPTTTAPTVVIRESRQNNITVHMELIFASEQSSLRSYQIYVNNVPLFGVHGKPINGHHVIASDSVLLISGTNKIEVSCRDERGIESLRAWQQVTSPVQSPSHIYFLGFGVSQYRDSMLNLRYADKDVRDLAAMFSSLPSAQSTHVHTFLNDRVTRNQLRSAAEFLQSAGPNDVVIMFIAGHGMYSAGTDATYYYLPYEADREHLESSSIPFEEFENLLHGIAPRRKLFFMDTCESGEAEDEGSTLSAQNNIPARSRAVRGFRTPGKKRRYLYQKDRYIYNNLSRRSGAIVFSSSLGGEYSYERDDFANGLFTEALMQALKGAADTNNDSKIDTYELRRYLRKTVSGWSNGAQNPTVDRDNSYQIIWLPVINRK